MPYVQLSGAAYVLPRRSWKVAGTCWRQAFVFYLGPCMFSSNITGTCFKSNGLKVCC